MKEVIIIGGGRSVLDGIETGLWEKIRGKEIWGLNFAYKMIPYPFTRQVWVDTTFYRNNITDLEILSRNGIQCHCKRNDRYNLIPNIIQHEATRKKEEMNTKLYIGGMGLVGFFALSLAVYEKYDKIYLLGYDWGTPSRSDTHTHFYQNQSGITYQSRGVGRPEVYIGDNSAPKKGVLEFEVYKNLAEIYNVSLISHIVSFPKIGYEEFYAKINS